MEENLTMEENPEVNSLPEETKEAEQSPRHRLNRPSRAFDNSGHVLEVLRAAMPYIDSRNQPTMETLLKATDLIHTTRNRSNTAELSAASLNTRPADLEGMLYSVREVGSFPERDLIDRILNFIRARKFYQTYRSLNQNRDILRTANSSQNTFGNNASFIEALRSILPPEQAANLDQVQTMMNAINAMNAMNAMNNNTNPYSNANGINNSNASANTSNATYSNKNYSSYNPYSNDQQPKQSYTAPNNTSANTSQAASTPSTPPWNAVNANGNIRNYTYNMNSDANKRSTQTPTTPPASSETNMTQLYNNVTNLYNALNSSGITRNQNGANNQTNMMNAITALANSGFFNNSTPQAQAPTSSVTTSTPFQSNITAFQQPTLQSMPIPDSNVFHPDFSTQQKDTRVFQPDELYQKLSDFRTANHWSATAEEHSNEMIEAASLDSK